MMYKYVEPSQMSNPRLRKDPEAPKAPEVSQAKQEEADNFLQQSLRTVGDGFGAVDDAYMGFWRDHLLRLPKEGVVPEDGFIPGIRNGAGSMLFQARTGAEGVNPNYQYRNLNGDPEWAAKSAMFANRALHAGGLTAAGVGLYELTGAIMNQFGGPADAPAESQLYM